MANSGQGKNYSSFFLAVVCLFITSLIASNIVAVKLIKVFGLVLPAAVIVFPISYIMADVLTEVYGYSAARRVIWLGFACNLMVVLVFWIGKVLPPAPFWQGQDAYDLILGYTPRLLMASFLAYLVGEFFNAYIMSRMKVLTKGKWLWIRTISSTLLGEGMDSLVFITIAFWGVMPSKVLFTAVVTQWLFKTGYEVAATPITYLVVNLLKRQEGLDIFDYDMDFSPFILRK